MTTNRLQASDVFRTVLLSAATLATLWALWEASTIFLVTFLGVLFGLVIGDAVDHLARLRVPRALGAAIVVVGLFGGLAGIGIWMAPTVAAQSDEIAQRLPDAVRRMEMWMSARERQALNAIAIQSTPATPTVAPPAASDSSGTEGLTAMARRSVTGITSYAFNMVGHTIEVLAYLLLGIFLAIYVAADPGLYHRGITHLIPHRWRRRTATVLSAVATALRRWLVAQVIAMVTLGVVWAIALSLLHVRAALALAVIAGFLEFVPIVGPTMAVVPALGMAVLDSPQKALAVLVVYLVIQTFEGNVLIPLLMKGRLDLPPAVTIVAQALLTLAFGFLGLMVAVPLTAAGMVAVKLLYVEPVVGDDMDVVSS